MILTAKRPPAAGAPTLLYIMGTANCGSTLLTMLLAEHPQIATVGELKGYRTLDTDTYRCSCGELIVDCRFWQELGAAVADVHPDFSVTNFGTRFEGHGSLAERLLTSSVRSGWLESLRELALLMPGPRGVLNRVLDNNAALMRATVARQDTAPTVFLDGSKDPIRLKNLLRLGWHTRVVFLVRDGRGVMNSYKKNYGLSAVDAADAFADSQAECLRMAAQLDPEILLTLRYEDLCLDKDGTLAQIYRHCGLAAPAGEPPSTHMLGNDTRLKSNKVRLDEKWRSSLDASDLDVFRRVGGTLNSRFYTEAGVQSEAEASEVKPT